jgi:hypothetical protein
MFDKICFVYGPEMSFLSGICLFNNFQCGLISTEDAPRLGK